MEISERRARLVRRHLLDGSGRSVLEATRAVLALHATDPATVYLSVLARASRLTLGDVGEQLYDDGRLVRLLAMRRTLFVVPTDEAGTVEAAASLGVARTLRKRLVTYLATQPTDPPLPDDPVAVETWLDDVIASTRAAAERLGSAAGAQLGAAEPRLRTALLPTTDKAYDVRRTITTQVLVLMGAEGHLVRGRPLGSWTSRQHTWRVAPDVRRPDEDAARVALVRRYLARFGPATETDVAWWTGWAKGVTRRALDELDLASSGSGYVLADDTDAEEQPPPTAALLPALDPTPMGWKERQWYLPEDPTPLYDRNGNVGPTVWWDGEVVGAWAVTPAGEIRVRLLVDRGQACAEAVEAAVAALEPRLEGAAVVPSFPTPCERELRAG